MAYEPRLSEMPSCCGILVPHKLFKNPDPRAPGYYIENAIVGKDNVEEDARLTEVWNKDRGAETDAEYIARIKTYLVKQQTQWFKLKSYLLVSMNSKENDILGDMMKEIGFEILVPMRRNPSGSQIILYFFDLLPKEEEKEKSSFIPTTEPVQPVAEVQIQVSA